jgi:hypothetical protein
MKVTLLILSTLCCQVVLAKAINPYDDVSLKSADQKLFSKEKQYEEKISFLENELAKYKSRLIEKSLYLEKSEESMRFKYEQEIAFLKKEVIYKTKSILEAQRQLEKINPSEDMKNLIKLNNELASQIRHAADQLAISQIKTEKEKGRAPASVKAK